MFFDEHWESLQKYTERLTAWLNVGDAVELPLTVNTDTCRNPYANLDNLRFRRAGLGVFLDRFPYSSLLIGPPGSGKSYALRTHAARWASWVDWQLSSGEFDASQSVIVPIYLDLKQYEGSLQQLADRLLPPETLQRLIDAGKANFLIDSFNEAPRKFLEDGTLPGEIRSWVEASADCRWIIASRTEEALDFFPGENFRIEEIEQSFVEEQLRLRSADLGQRHAADLLRLFRRPFFFTAYINQRLKLQPGGTHPAQAVESMLASYEFELWTEIQQPVELAIAFGPLAKIAIDSGEELIARDDLEAALCPRLAGHSAANTARRIIERLVQRGFLLKYDERRLAFYHQSLTELMAAKEASILLRENFAVIDQLLESTRWDEALGFLLYYLDADTTEEFFRRLIRKDMQLAVRCARFSEYDRSRWVGLILDALFAAESETSFQNHRMQGLMKSLPVDKVHAARLERLLTTKVAGAGAIFLLAKAMGAAVKEKLIDLSFESPLDYNLGQDVGNAIKPLMTAEDIPQLFDRLARTPYPTHIRNCAPGVVELFRRAFAEMSPSSVVADYRHRTGPPRMIVEAVCSWASGLADPFSLQLLVEMITAGHSRAIYALNSCIRYQQSHPDLDSLLTDEQRLDFWNTLERALREPEFGQWTLELIEVLSLQSKFVFDQTQKLLERSRDAQRVALLARMPEHIDEFWQCTADLIHDQNYVFEDWELELLHVWPKADWTGREALVLAGIERRIPQLAHALIHDWKPIIQTSLEWPWVKQQLEWIEPIADSELPLVIRFSEFVNQNASRNCRKEMIREFQDPACPRRRFLAKHFVKGDPQGLTVEWTEETIRFLIEELHHKALYPSDPTLLAKIVTEHTIRDVLLPTLDVPTEPYRQNIRVVLTQAGARFRKRYL